MYKFSDTTRNILTASGWQENRKLDIQAFKAELVIEGYPWFEQVEYFLQEFGGLKVRFLGQDGTHDFFHFDVSKAAKDIDARWIKEDYSSRLQNVNLCVIGQALQQAYDVDDRRGW